jgi:non-specific serine/threonine protein kinase
LTGAGGCGKTRLALELAAELVPEFPGGAWLVELASVADAGLILQAIVSALGIRERAGEALLTTVVRSLSTRQTLLVLDNCEHVIEACARDVEDLLDHCPSLRVLATSREALRIPGERTWRVPSLAVPDGQVSAEELGRVPAIQLFVERVQASMPSFALGPRAAAVGRICTRLDGLPLAIELAAARVPALGVDQTLRRLDDSIHLLVGGSRTAPTRQQTLRATLDWSHSLLGDGERAMFRRLSVFAEGCDLEAVETVCGDGGHHDAEVLDLLARLVDKSLVILDETNQHARYRLLEPVRQYAQEQLEMSGERDRVRRRHAVHYLTFAEARAYETNIGGPRRFIATRELAGEYPNLRSALAWSVEHHETQFGLRLAGSLLFFWQIYGPVTEGLAWLEQLMAMPAAEEPTSARAWALLAAGFLAQLRGDFDMAAAFCQEGARIAHGVAEPALEWIAYLFLGNGARGVDLAAARPFYTQALVCSRAAGLKLCEGQSLAVLAHTACDEADYVAAAPLAERALAMARLGQDALNEIVALVGSGRAALGQGELNEARAHLEKALDVARRIGEPRMFVAFILDPLGELELASNRPGPARVYLARCLELRHEGGERFGMVKTLDRLAALAAVSAQPERALKLAAAADALNDVLGVTRSPDEQKFVERWLQSARTALTEGAASAARAEGQALRLEDAIQFALDPRDATPTPLTPPPRPVRSLLSSREQEVAILLARGLSNPQVAAELVISVHTAQRHVENILAKLGLNSRAQVAAWAVSQGLAKPATSASTG